MKSKDSGVIVVPWTGNAEAPAFWLMRYVAGPPEVYRRWAFPGGGIEEGESALDAAKRELLEETGLDLPYLRLRRFGPTSIHERVDGSIFRMHYFNVWLRLNEKPKQTEPEKHGPWGAYTLLALPRPIAPSGEIAIGRFLTSDTRL